MAKKKKSVKKEALNEIANMFKFTGNFIIMLDMENYGPMIFESIGDKPIFREMTQLLIKHGIGNVMTQTPLESSVAIGLINQAKSR
jgi:hypothetical protein